MIFLQKVGDWNEFEEFDVEDKNFMEELNKRKISIGQGTVLGEGVKIWYGVKIGEDGEIEKGTEIENKTTIGDGVKIGENSSIGGELIIGDGVTIGKETVMEWAIIIGTSAMIGDNVMIGHASKIGEGAKIMDKVKIEDRTKIGDYAKITKTLSIFSKENIFCQSGIVMQEEKNNDLIGIFYKAVTPNLQDFCSDYQYKEGKGDRNEKLIRVQDRRYKQGWYFGNFWESIEFLNIRKLEGAIISAEIKLSDILQIFSLPWNSEVRTKAFSNVKVVKFDF